MDTRDCWDCTDLTCSILLFFSVVDGALLLYANDIFKDIIAQLISSLDTNLIVCVFSLFYRVTFFCVEELQISLQVVTFLYTLGSFLATFPKRGSQAVVKTKQRHACC